MATSSSTPLPLTPSASNASTISAPSPSTFKALTVSYADRIRVGLPASTSNPTPTSLSSTSTSGPSSQTQSSRGQGQLEKGGSSSHSSSSPMSSRDASQSGSGNVNGGGGKGKSGGGGGPSHHTRQGTPAGSGNGTAIGPVKNGKEDQQASTSQSQSQNKKKQEVDDEDGADWQEVVSHPKVMRGASKEKSERQGRREFGSGHREERMINDAHGGKIGGGGGGGGMDRSNRRDRDGSSLGLARNMNPNWERNGKGGDREREQIGSSTSITRSDASTSSSSTSAVSLTTIKPIKGGQARPPIGNQSVTDDGAESKNPETILPPTSSTAVPPSPSLGTITTLEQSSTSASLRSPQPSQSETEDVHVVGSNGWETPTSTEGSGEVSARASTNVKPALPPVNIWQVRKERMTAAASMVTGVIAAATANVANPGTNALGVFPSINGNGEQKKDKGGKPDQERQTRSSVAGSAQAEKVDTRASSTIAKSTERSGSHGGGGGAKGERKAAAVPSLSDQKVWPEVALAATIKTHPEVQKKQQEVEEGDAGKPAAKKEKKKWVAISAKEMQEAVDSAKRKQQSEASKSKRAATAAASSSSTNPDGSPVENKRARNTKTSGEKGARAEGQASQTAPEKKAKAASVKGSPVVAQKGQAESATSIKGVPTVKSDGGAGAGTPLDKKPETVKTPKVIVKEQVSADASTPVNEVPSSAPSVKAASTKAASTEGSIDRKEPKKRAASQSSQDRQVRSPTMNARGGSFSGSRGGGSGGMVGPAHPETMIPHPYSPLAQNYGMNGFTPRGRGGGSGRGGRGARGGMRGGIATTGARFNNGNNANNEPFSGGVPLSGKSATFSMQNNFAGSPITPFQPAAAAAYGYQGTPYDYGYYGYAPPPSAYYQPMPFGNTGYENPYAPLPVPTQPPPPLPITDVPGLDVSRIYILGQLEYYFSMQNLAMDFFLRQQMDSQGWIDIAMIASFNRIKNLTTDLALVSEVAKLSSILEVKHDKLRLSDGKFRQWVLPDAPPATFSSSGDGGIMSPLANEMALGGVSSADLSENAREQIEKDVTRDVLKSHQETPQQANMDADSTSSSSATVVGESKGDMSVGSVPEQDLAGIKEEKVEEGKATSLETETSEENVISL